VEVTSTCVRIPSSAARGDGHTCISPRHSVRRGGIIDIHAHFKVFCALRSDTPTAFWFLASRTSELQTEARKRQQTVGHNHGPPAARQAGSGLPCRAEARAAPSPRSLSNSSEKNRLFAPVFKFCSVIYQCRSQREVDNDVETYC
jgi:hypothetical protein